MLPVSDVVGAVFVTGARVTKGGAEVRPLGTDICEEFVSATENDGASSCWGSLGICDTSPFESGERPDFGSTRLGNFALNTSGGIDADGAWD